MPPSQVNTYIILPGSWNAGITMHNSNIKLTGTNASKNIKHPTSAGDWGISFNDLILNIFFLIYLQKTVFIINFDIL